VARGPDPHFALDADKVREPFCCVRPGSGYSIIMVALEMRPSERAGCRQRAPPILSSSKIRSMRNISCTCTDGELVFEDEREMSPS